MASEPAISSPSASSVESLSFTQPPEQDAWVWNQSPSVTSLLYSECVPDRQQSQRHLSKNKGPGHCHFPPPPLSINTEPQWEAAQQGG